MKLQQGQIWKAGGTYLRIVGWERLRIEYKAMPSPDTKEGTLHEVSKKEFCRLIKNATLVEPEPAPEESPDPSPPTPDPSPPTPDPKTINRP